MPRTVSHHLDGVRPLDDFSSTLVWLVDKDPCFCEAVEQQLLLSGFKRFTKFQSGTDCLRAFEGTGAPDLILLDLELDVPSGLDVLKGVRRHPKGNSIPILVMTGEEEGQVRNAAITLGASNLISKPFEPETLADLARNLIKLDRQAKELAAYKARVSKELRAAERLQNNLLPDESVLEACRSKTGLNFAAASHSSTELSGDFWGVKEVRGQKVTLFMADIVGHGIAAAANTHRLHEVLIDEPLIDGDLKGYLERVNLRFYDRTPVDVFASLLVGTIDLESGTFSYGSAMAPSPLLMRSGAEIPLMLMSSGLPLGVTHQPDYEINRVPFELGDSLFFYSDALSEAPNHIGGQLGPLKPCEYISKAMRRDPAKVLPYVESQFFSDIKGPLHDDLTMVLISPKQEGHGIDA